MVGVQRRNIFENLESLDRLKWHFHNFLYLFSQGPRHKRQYKSLVHQVPCAKIILYSLERVPCAGQTLQSGDHPGFVLFYTRPDRDFVRPSFPPICIQGRGIWHATQAKLQA